MTREAFTASPPYPISDVGPFQVLHPYKSGALIVAVVLDGERVELTDDEYTVSPASSASTGEVTLTTQAANDYDGGTLYIQRATEVEQGWVGQSARETGLEVQLDWFGEAIQDLTVQLRKTLRTDTALPPMTPQIGRTIVWTEDGFIPGPNAEDIAEAAPNAAAAKMWAEVALNATPTGNNISTWNRTLDRQSTVLILTGGQSQAIRNTTIPDGETYPEVNENVQFWDGSDWSATPTYLNYMPLIGSLIADRTGLDVQMVMTGRGATDIGAKAGQATGGWTGSPDDRSTHSFAFDEGAASGVEVGDIITWPALVDDFPEGSGEVISITDGGATGSMTVRLATGQSPGDNYQLFKDGVKIGRVNGSVASTNRQQYVEIVDKYHAAGWDRPVDFFPFAQGEASDHRTAENLRDEYLYMIQGLTELGILGPDTRIILPSGYFNLLNENNAVDYIRHADTMQLLAEYDPRIVFVPLLGLEAEPAEAAANQSIHFGFEAIQQVPYRVEEVVTKGKTALPYGALRTMTTYGEQGFLRHIEHAAFTTDTTLSYSDCMGQVHPVSTADGAVTITLPALTGVAAQKILRQGYNVVLRNDSAANALTINGNGKGFRLPNNRIVTDPLVITATGLIELQWAGTHWYARDHTNSTDASPLVARASKLQLQAEGNPANKATFDTSLLTGSRQFQFPNAGGEIATKEYVGSIIPAGLVFNPLQYGAVGDDPENDDGPALNAALAAYRAAIELVPSQYGNIDFDGLGRVYYSTIPIDATSISTWGAAIRNMTIVSSAAGKPAFDLTGTRGNVVDQVLVYGDPDNPPSVGIQSARATGGSSQDAFCDNVSWRNVQTRGWFTVAGAYCYGQETAHHDHCAFWNDNPDGLPIVLMGYDEEPYTSEFMTPHTGGTSMINNVYTNCDYRYSPSPRNRGVITAITRANPMVVTVSAGHPLVVGQDVVIAGVSGMVEADGLIAEITAISGNDITLGGVNSTAFTAYTSGGILIRKQTKPSVLLGRCSDQTFTGCYVVNYGSDHVVVRWPDGETPEQLRLGFLCEGYGNRSNFRFECGAAAKQVHGGSITSYATHAKTAVVSTDASGGGGVSLIDFDVSMPSRYSTAVSPRMFSDESKFTVLGDIAAYAAASIDIDDFAKLRGQVMLCDTGETFTASGFHKSSLTGMIDSTTDVFTLRVVGPGGTLVGDLAYDDTTDEWTFGTVNGTDRLKISASGILPTNSYVQNIGSGTAAFLNVFARALRYDATGGVYANGTKILGLQGAALPADATDLASAIALVNAMKARLVAHGLVAS